MNTSSAVQQILDSNPYLSYFLAKDLINLSALAQFIKADVENLAFKDLTTSAVLSALQRNDHKNSLFNQIDHASHIGKVSLVSNISAVTIENDSELNKILADISSEVYLIKGSYFSYTKGSWQTTILSSTELDALVRGHIKQKNILYEFKNIAKVSVELKNNHLKIPGIIAYVLMQLALKGINIIEVLSTSDELSILVENAEAGNSFHIINNLA